MDFQLSEDQEALQEGIRSFCEGRFPVERFGELEERDAFDASLWAELAEMGVFGLRVPSEEGGVGLGAADAVLVFAELGRRLLPGPIFWSHLAAGLVEGAATGQVVVGGLDRMGKSAGPVLVTHYKSLDSLLVLRPEGVDLIEAGALDGRAISEPLDPLTPVHHVESLPEGERVGGPELASRLRLEGAALAAAQLLGIAEVTTELALAYAKEREQFGRPIGSFQAVKHILADMFVRQEVARATVYAAGATIDQPDVGDLERAVSAAKIVAGEAALKNSRACIQVYGGMGYTWEVPAHYYLKRAWVLGSVFGNLEEHEERVAHRFATQPSTAAPAA
jgi:alkylation response protein AidB-like acyl-CoA dehydrogenase